MYTAFYNLTEKPFNLTPSPRYLYLGEVHKEALAFLTYGVVERKGFILLTGEVGTGKTTMVQALLANLDKNVERVYISNPLLSTQDFIDYLAFSAFKRKVRFKSKADFLVEFEQFLKECLQHQKTFLLIIDEAQRLSFSLLEEIRLLSNMETADEKLINIFLVGQPELNERIAEPRCRALLQRISVRHHIRPLDLEETREYIMTRLKIAGCHEGGKIFPRSTIKALYEYSEGYPRMINILGDNALLLGYAREKHKITPGMIRECYEEIRLKDHPRKEVIKKIADDKMALPISRTRYKFWKWAAILLLIAAIGVLAAYLKQDVVSKLGQKSRMLLPPHKDVQPVPQPSVTEMPARPLPETSKEQPQKIDEKGGPISEEEAQLSGDMPQEKQLEAELSPKGPPPQTIGLVEEESPIQSGRTIVVKRGDTLAQLATEVYGWADQKVLNLIQKHNPEIRDVNQIRIGQKIFFPPLSATEAAPIYTVHIASYKPFASAREEFQRLTAEGYEAYIIPVNDAEKGRVYRITLGNFDDLEKANTYAATLIQNGVTDYAKPMQLEVR